MARPDGVHCAYKPTDAGPLTTVVDPTEISIERTEAAALRKAVTMKGEYVFWPHGVTLADAIRASAAATAEGEPA